MLLGEQKTTAFDYGGDEYIVFSEDGVTEWPVNKAMYSPEGAIIIGLSNSGLSHSAPARGLISTLDCYIVQATSTNGKWYQWKKEKGGQLTVLDVWDELELQDFA